VRALFVGSSIRHVYLLSREIMSDVHGNFSQSRIIKELARADVSSVRSAR